MVRPYIFFVLLFGASFFVSCGSAEEQEPNLSDAEYFPLKVGAYQIYSVEETVYQLGVPATSSYELKTVVADSFQDAAASVTYVLARSKRMSPSDAWTSIEPWAARQSEREAIVTRNGHSYLVLQFPLFDGSNWNGNAYNNEVNPGTNVQEDTYTVQAKNTPYTFNGKTFADCVVIEQENNEEFIVFHDERKEIYGRNVGLVSREVIQLSYCNDDDRNCIGEQIIDEGVIYKQVMLSYGVE